MGTYERPHSSLYNVVKKKRRRLLGLCWELTLQLYLSFDFKVVFKDVSNLPATIPSLFVPSSPQ